MRGLLLGAALIATISPAVAADMFIPDEEWPAYGISSSGWSGQYLGATIGGQRTRINVPGQGVLEGLDLIGGIFAGVNYDEDGLILGAEADVEYSGFDETIACSDPAWSCRGYMNAQGSLRARLGFGTDSFLVYGTAGLAFAHLGGSTTSPGDVVYEDSSVRTGWTVGAGVEVAFNDSWFGRAEYRYTDFGPRDMTFDVVYPDISASTHAVRAGIGYRF